jgi:hypothetical protein
VIIFFAKGRLGNHIFQYAFLKSIRENNELMILPEMQDLLDIFDIVDAKIWIPRNKYIRSFIYRIYFFGIFDKLAKTHLIPSIFQNRVIENGFEIDDSTFSKTKGFFRSTKYVERGYYQSELFFDKNIIDSFKIRKQYIDKAKEYIADIPTGSYKIFVHIRRGDYLTVSFMGDNPALPIYYYKERINWFLNNKNRCFFIFLSDDSRFVEKEFAYLTNKIISSNTVGVDLAIMALCQGAIVSNSSLAWWGTYFMENRDKAFAPLYWIGFNKRIWFPKGIRSDIFEYIEIC